MFCTISDLENLLHLSIPTEKIPSAEAAIAAATQAIKNYTCQTISQVVDDAITLDGNGKTRLFLPELPVTGITSVTVDGSSLVDGTDYKLGMYGVLYRLGGYVWTAGIANIEVVYSHGYASIPDDIVNVCARAAARAYQAGLRAEELGGVAVQSLGLGDYQVAFGAENHGEGYAGVSGVRPLLLSEKDLLNRYRLVSQ